ncbi:MAG: NADH:ubiquinone oxidoreductase subunit N [Gammaproteobacteria bacterium]|nr:MAG: NADH:ubiquinone oxidoreductase subunit N [Gammaproteobacteria bacterium]
MFVSDPMGAVLKLFIVMIVFVAFIYSRNYLRDRHFRLGEYFVLGLFATLGMMIMVSAHSLLTVYLGLELLSLSLYTMVAMHRQSQLASEAAMKYFVLGAIASGMLLYGMSMLYGVTGTLDLTVLAQSIHQIADDHTIAVSVAQSISEIKDHNITVIAIGQQVSENAGGANAAIAQILAENTDNGIALAAINPIVDQVLQSYRILVFGLVFVIIGVAFKLGAVPFHVWIPDVYQGAPTAVTLFIASAPKIAAFAMLMRLLVDGMQNLQTDWQNILILLSILSMVTGNIIALAQTNIKRMLAYSTIAHVGYLMLGILTGTQEGYAASMFYVVVYTLMTLGAFGMIVLLSHAGFEASLINDFKGLNERNAWYAALMLILMLSMAGVPPMIGFWAKWYVLAQVVNAGFIWLAVLGVLFAVIGAFYYLRIIKLMYFDKAENRTPIEAPMDMRIALSANALVILLLGIMPHTLMTVCLEALGI